MNCKGFYDGDTELL
jgi:hypothetical protein